MRRSILFLCLLMVSSVLFSQNEQQEINAIKSDLNYLYATGTSIASEDEATENAKDLLVLEIEQWLKENNTSDIAGYVAKSKERLSQIMTKRGKLYRVFAFVKKNDILPYFGEEKLMVVSYGDAQNSKTENQQPSQTIDATPAAVVPAKTEVDSVAESNVVQNIAVPIVSKPSYTPNAMEQEMLNIKTFVGLNDYINRGREDESIVEVGKYSNLPKSGMVYVFVHNREGKIAACMKVVDGTPTNLSSGGVDEITNYKGCGAIWIRIKEAK